MGTLTDIAREILISVRFPTSEMWIIYVLYTVVEYQLFCLKSGVEGIFWMKVCTHTCMHTCCAKQFTEYYTEINRCLVCETHILFSNNNFSIQYKYWKQMEIHFFFTKKKDEIRQVWMEILSFISL